MSMNMDNTNSRPVTGAILPYLPVGFKGGNGWGWVRLASGFVVKGLSARSEPSILRPCLFELLWLTTNP